MNKSESKVNWEKYSENVQGPTPVTFVDDHVGGCNIYGDPVTELPKMWKHIVDTLNVKSVVDLGCGFGFHTKYFKESLNCEVHGIEGSQKVVELSLLPNDIVWHDYTTGKYSLNKPYDLAWCIECVEHIDEKYVDNFMETFSNCKYVAMTHGLPGQGGYHHVNCQLPQYWIDVFHKWGFELMEPFTNECREISKIDNSDFLEWIKDWRNPAPDKPYRGPAAENAKYLLEKHYKAHSSDIPWGFYFAENGMIFKNVKLG